VSSKKQRRRREKLKRHEWEFVRYDEEGNEIPVEPAQLRKTDERPKRKAETNGKPAAQRDSGKGRRRPLREVKPPSWSRAIKRGALFAPFLFLFLTAFEHVDPLVAVAYSLLYPAIFIPMFFFVDRLTYRSYRRRAGGGA